MTLPVMWPAIMSAAILIFTIVFDDFVLAFFTSGVDPQPLSVRIYSAIRFGIQPSINAVGTLMLVGSLVLIAIALLIPRLFGRRATVSTYSEDNPPCPLQPLSQRSTDDRVRGVDARHYEVLRRAHRRPRLEPRHRGAASSSPCSARRGAARPRPCE